MTILSRLVANAFLPPAQAKALLSPEQWLTLGTKRPLTQLLLTLYNQKTVLVTLAGGIPDLSQVKSDAPYLLTPDGVDIRFTPLGQATYENALRFVAPGKRVILRYLTCTCGKEAMRGHIVDTLAFAQEGDLIVFLGDLTLACDGKILPHLGLVGNGNVLLPTYDQPSKE